MLFNEHVFFKTNQHFFSKFWPHYIVSTSVVCCSLCFKHIVIYRFDHTIYLKPYHWNLRGTTVKYRKFERRPLDNPFKLSVFNNIVRCSYEEDNEENEQVNGVNASQLSWCTQLFIRRYGIHKKVPSFIERRKFIGKMCETIDKWWTKPKRTIHLSRWRSGIFFSIYYLNMPIN